MSEHHFDVGFATEFGIEEAILINTIDFWLQKNKSNTKNFKEKTYWTKFKIFELQKYFPYLTESQIRYALNNLLKEGVLIVKQFDKEKWDRTNYYTFDKEFLDSRSDKITFSISENSNIDKTKLKNNNKKINKFKLINKINKEFSKENNNCSLKEQMIDSLNSKRKYKFKYSLDQIKNSFPYIDLWNDCLNKLPNKHKLNKMSKVLEDCYEKINALKNGTFLNKYYIGKKEIENNKININELKQGLSDERIKEGIKNSLLQFELCYYPYTEKDKLRMLPRSLNQTIYNDDNRFNMKSSFLKCLYNKPIKKDEKLEKQIILNKDEEYAFSILTELNCFDEKDISQLSVDLYKKYYSIMYRKVDGIIAKDILSYKVGDFEYFCNLFKEYIEKKKQDNEDLEADKKFDFKMFRSLINQNKDDSHLWKDFTNYLDKVYGINFKISEMEILLYKETMKELAKENSKNT